MTEPPAPAPSPSPALPASAPSSAAETDAATTNDKKEKKKKKKDKNAKDSALSRSVETMFKVTYQNHMGLSQLADNKANMLISINGVIISLMIALLTPRFGSLSWTLLPVFVLLAGCMISLTFAVLGSRPRVDRTKVTVEQVRNNSGNVLFFGRFMNMPLEDFQAALRLLTQDHKLLHDHLARQLYEMGAALTRKYRRLQTAYSVFLAGTALASMLFALLLLVEQVP